MAPTGELRTPETVLLAVLHEVGSEVRLADNFDFARIFNDAAAKHGGIFAPFAWHRHYQVSEVLSSSLQVLDQAASIVRENAAQTYFRVSPHAAGPYGKRLLDSLDPADQEAARMIAVRLREAFGGQRKPVPAG